MDYLTSAPIQSGPFAEGPTRVVSKHFTFNEDAAAWTTADFRFTCTGRTVYAFQMAYPEGRQAFIRSLGQQCGAVRTVSVLGAPGPVSFYQYEDGLLVRLPDTAVCAFMPCIKVELA